LTIKLTLAQQSDRYNLHNALRYFAES
jgi:hypothetical protein